jgi:hypothetical protein
VQVAMLGGGHQQLAGHALHFIGEGLPHSRAR